MTKLKKHDLNYRFHNPNTLKETTDFLVKLFVEVNRPKAEAAIQEEAKSIRPPQIQPNESIPEPKNAPTLRSSDCEKPSVPAKLHT